MPYSLPLIGSCMCGAVQVEVTAPPLLTLACHCRDCQKLTASAFSMTTMFPRAAFSCSGELITGALGTPGRRHYFCKSCLNFIYSDIGEDNPRINLRTSLLDQAAAFAPYVELMTDQKLPWATTTALRSFSGFPQTADELQDLLDGYAEWITRQ